MNPDAASPHDDTTRSSRTGLTSPTADSDWSTPAAPAGLTDGVVDAVAVSDPDKIGGDVEHWAALARAVLSDEGVDPTTLLNVVYVDEPTMADLNAEHMGADGATDVLAFPIDGRDRAPAGPTLAGDVVICPAVAQRNAEELGRSTQDELALLLVHGILHVLGMDHAESAERARMQARERDLLARHHAARQGGQPE